MDNGTQPTQLRRSRIELALEGRGVVVLVDPAACPAATGNRLGLQQIQRLELSGLVAEGDREREVLPYLASLSHEPARMAWQQRSLEEWAMETHGVSWIESALAIDLLAQRLSVRLNATISDDQAVVLRICDTRVLPEVAAVLDEDERSVFLQPMTVWWYFDRREQLQRLRGNPAPAEDDGWTAPWHLKREQEAALLAAAEPDTVIAIIREQAPAELNAIARHQRHDLIAAQIEQARVWGLSSSQEFALYCLVALRRGPLFAWQPAWQRQLSRVRKGSISFEDAIVAAERDAQ